MDSIFETIELDFVVLEFHENYVVSELKEGVVLEQKHLDRLLKTCTAFFRDKKFGYISKRIHNYNVNPLVYYKLMEVENLVGIAIICSSENSRSTANFEKNFSKIPFEVFLNFEDALKWTQNLLKK